MHTVQERLLSYFDIVDVIGEYVPLKKNGVREYIGFCPIRSHSKPTLQVSQENQEFACTECGIGGSLITFLSLKECIPTAKAEELLAQRENIPLDRNSEDFKSRLMMFSAHDLAAKLYHHILMDTEEGLPGRQYLESRGVTVETMKTFHLGYAPDSWNTIRNFLVKRGFSESLLTEAGLIAESSNHKGRFYDRFRNRVMFPIQDDQGRVIGFGGRAISKDQEHKYLNSPDTPIFKKGRNLYNLHRAAKPMSAFKTVNLLEGYMDVVSAYQNGVMNVVAALGTALTAEHVRKLHHYTKEIVMNFDGDAAGKKAILRSAEILKAEDMSARVALIPHDMDPDEYVREYGRQAYLDVIQDAMPLIQYQMMAMRDHHDLKTQEGKQAFVREVVEKVLVDVHDPSEQERYMSFLKVLKNN